MAVINDDPIYDVRLAVAAALRRLSVPCDHKQVTDLAVDLLPDFFRQPLVPAQSKTGKQGIA